MALDPIEKKPLAFYMPGSLILSVGSYGCNLSCPFCQNFDISSRELMGFEDIETYDISPELLCQIAQSKLGDGNIGLAYTYNEALVGYEFVRDTARLVHEANMKNVLVTNGTVELPILEEIIPYIDAMNIDLKGFRPEVYRRLGGDLETAKQFISRSVKSCHVELTSLIVPGFNDSLEDMERQAEWIAGISPDIPLHITRYFPRYKMHKEMTDISLMSKMQEIAVCKLKHVVLGNI